MDYLKTDESCPLKIFYFKTWENADYKKYTLNLLTYVIIFLYSNIKYNVLSQHKWVGVVLIGAVHQYYAKRENWVLLDMLVCSIFRQPVFLFLLCGKKFQLAKQVTSLALTLRASSVSVIGPLLSYINDPSPVTLGDSALFFCWWRKNSVPTILVKSDSFLTCWAKIYQ